MKPVLILAAVAISATPAYPQSYNYIPYTPPPVYTAPPFIPAQPAPMLPIPSFHPPVLLPTYPSQPQTCIGCINPEDDDD